MYKWHYEKLQIFAKSKNHDANLHRPAQRNKGGQLRPCIRASLLGRQQRGRCDLRHSQGQVFGGVVVLELTQRVAHHDCGDF